MSLPKDCFKSIYLGKDIPEKIKKQILEIVHDVNKDMNVYQMVPDPESMKMVPRSLDLNAYMKDLTSKDRLIKQGRDLIRKLKIELAKKSKRYWFRY